MKKSDRTRAAIMDAAKAMFAEHGYEATTVRAIAERASIDPSMIIRYYGSKEELFALASRVELRLPDLSGRTHEQVGRALVGHFLDLWEGTGRDMGLSILLRAAVTNEDAADKIRAVFREQVRPALGRVATGEGTDTRIGMIATQLFGLALCRYILKLPPVATMTHDELVDRIAPAVCLHLFGGAPDGA